MKTLLITLVVASLCGCSGDNDGTIVTEDPNATGRVPDMDERLDAVFSSTTIVPIDTVFFGHERRVWELRGSAPQNGWLNEARLVSGDTVDLFFWYAFITTRGGWELQVKVWSHTEEEFFEGLWGLEWAAGK